MTSDDLTTRVLIEIRDEIRGTNRRVDTLNERVERLEAGQTELRREANDVRREMKELRGSVVELHRQQVESDVRSATMFAELNGTMRDIHVLLRDRFLLSDRVERCEKDIEDLKRRVS